ncbi:MAG: ECF-type sigma factor [Pseudomonadota bacterium]
MVPASTITALLQDWGTGNQDALAELTPLIYDDLHRIASRRMRSERADHTLQATALVNEAFSRLSDAELSVRDRAHFFAIAARTMRRILTDYGRRHRSKKRGEGVASITLHEDRVSAERPLAIADLDEALDKFAAIDERKCDVLVLHYFGGMTYDEMALATGISPATVSRDLTLAKAWLAHELADD